MDDKGIIDLYFARDEQAIAETDLKYGKYCRAVAKSILVSREDCEECLSDTYLRAWNAMPPQRPKSLSAFLGRITRNLALDRFRHLSAEKRAAGECALAIDELGECVSSPESTERIIDEMALARILDGFLRSLSAGHRKIFMQRYWYMRSVREIATDLAVSESRVKMSLHRSRRALKELLEKECAEI